MITLKPKQFSFRFFFLFLFVIGIFSSCKNNNWPQFRGPNSNQIALEKELPQQWGNDENLLWKYDLEGRGWCSPIIWGKKVFFTNAVLEDPSILPSKPKKGRLENPFDAVYNFEVICIDLDTGEEIWKKVAYHGKPKYKTHRDNNYAPETMVTDGQFVYAYFGMTGMYCYDLAGNLIWEKDLGNYPMQSNWGTSTSPLLYNHMLFMQIDNEEQSFLAALDAKTGEEQWRVERDEKSNWGTPIIWENSIRTELIAPGGKARSYNPENGNLYWELDMQGGRNISSPTPVSDTLVMGNEKRSNGGGTLFGVKAGASGDISLKEGENSNEWVVWSVPESGIAMASPLIYKGLIYIVERNRGRINCYEASSGNVIYQGTDFTDAKAFWASPWAFDDKIYCLDESGVTYVIQAGEKFVELEQNKLDDIFWSSVAIAKNSYVFRGENGIYCIRDTN